MSENAVRSNMHKGVRHQLTYMYGLCDWLIITIKDNELYIEIILINTDHAPLFYEANHKTRSHEAGISHITIQK